MRDIIKLHTFTEKRISATGVWVTCIKTKGILKIVVLINTHGNRTTRHYM